ncbi:MAG TPA: lytic transglycosylase domain-containing protein [Chondromyces sp.]|nr:lytic transglycosylase domain-containing protein [Chondromyces sp.]
MKRLLRPFATVLLTAAAGSAAANGAVASARVSVPAPDRSDLRRMVVRVSEERGLDPRLVDALVRVESDYDPQAVSRRGAMGLMQLMPETARRLSVEDPFDPEDNVRGGTRELSRLVERYAGNLQLALAAYNAGEGAVAQYKGVPPYSETRTYVARILSLYTGRPYSLQASYRRAPVRVLKGLAGATVITNMGGGGSAAGAAPQTLEGGPLRGGFGTTR